MLKQDKERVVAELTERLRLSETLIVAAWAVDARCATMAAARPLPSIDAVASAIIRP